MGSNSCALPRITNAYDDIHRSPSNIKTEKSDGRYRLIDTLQPLTTESGLKRRARHEANQRHSEIRESSPRSYRNSSANEADI